jgi:hypothetical protein
MDSEHCHPSKNVPNLCQTHGFALEGKDCVWAYARRSNLRTALNDLAPVLVDWLAGMVEGAAEEAGEVDGRVRQGYRGAAALLRRWDYRAEFDEDA